MKGTLWFQCWRVAVWGLVRVWRRVSLEKAVTASSGQRSWNKNIFVQCILVKHFKKMGYWERISRGT